MQFKTYSLVFILLIGSAVSFAQKETGPYVTPVGGDRDRHGCVPSTGATWSYILKKCVGIWRVGVKLLRTEQSNYAAYLIFSSDRKLVEVSMQGGEDSLVLTRNKTGVYAYKKYQVEATPDGYVLKKDGKAIYASAGKTGGAPATLVVEPIDIEGDLGQVTFSKGNNTIFYYNLKSKRGKVRLNGSEYTLNKFAFKDGTYTLSGSGVSISTGKCSYQKSKGEDCNYGTLKNVAITLKSKTKTELTNVKVQDCPDY